MLVFLCPGKPGVSSPSSTVLFSSTLALRLPGHDLINDLALFLAGFGQINPCSLDALVAQKIREERDIVEAL